MADFFAMLGLNPDEPWDEGAFEHALNEKRALWSRQRTGIKTHPVTVEAQRNLTLLRDLQRVMRDPGLRENERAEARRRREDERRGQRDRFAGRVELILDKGYLYDAEAEMLLSEADALGVDSTLRRRLERAERRPFRRAREDQRRLDAGIERNLRANLAIVNEPNLYAVLARVDDQVTEASDPSLLLAAADALYRKARNIADKTKPEVGAMQVLAGLAKLVFGSDDLRRKHHVSMALAPLDAILSDFEDTLKHVRAVDARQFERFLRKAAAKGIETALAREIFVAHFRELNWSVEPPSAAAEAALTLMKRCPYCDDLSDPDARSCANCGRSLSDPCPNCGAGVTAWAGACRACGFRAGLRGWAELLCEQAEASLNRYDLDQAADALDQAEQIWNLPPERRDDLRARLAEGRAELSRRRAAVAEKAGQIAALRSARRYLSARRELDALTYTWPGREGLLAECQAKVAAADRLCEQAARPGMPDDRRAELCLRALRICADHEDAREELALIPPSPPTGLAVHADEDTPVVRLSWNPAPDPGCESVVIRADGPVAPGSAAAGPGREPRTITSDAAWDDTEPVIGRATYYAVYTQRHRTGTRSRLAAVTSDPVILTERPRLVVTPRNGEAELSWNLHHNALRLELQRDEPASTAGPVRLAPAPGSDRLVDRRLANGTTYRYTAYAVFGGPGGQPVRSRAVVREATPARPPSPPPPPSARGEPPSASMPLFLHRVELRWTEPPAGAIKVVRAGIEELPALRAGDEFPEADLARKGLVLSGPQPLRDTWFSGTRPCGYVPVLVMNGHCYVGEARRYAAGPEVADLRADYRGMEVRLTWTWPAGVDEALVAWDEAGAPFDPSGARHQARVHRDPGSPGGRHDIPVRAVPRLFAQVAAVVREDNTEFITSGAGVSVRRPSIALRYEVQRAGGFGGRRLRLVLRPDRPAWLPVLELRAPGHDATVRVPAGPVERELAVPVPETATSPRDWTLALADPADADWVHISHSS